MTATPLAWDGGRLDGTEWQGIGHLSIELLPGTDHPAVITAHLNHPVGTLVPDDVRVTGGRRIPTPPHEITVAGSSVVIAFEAIGDHSPYTVALLDGGGRALHPFFSTATFRFTVDCDAGDCRPATLEARRAPVQAPAVDLLTKDFNGFVRLLADWVKVRHPHVTDLSPASFERMVLELLAWYGDMASYFQDRVANEAFIETASQRYSLRQHAVLLGARIDDGQAPTTVLAFEPSSSGFVPAGLQVRVRTAPDEVPVTFTVRRRTRVLAANRSSGLHVAAFPDAFDAVVPAGARSLLLWSHTPDLVAGDRVAFVQGSFSQIVTLVSTPVRTSAAGWVQHPSQPFDPSVDPPAAITELRWREPLDRDLRPWSGPPLAIHANLADAVYGTPRRAVGERGAGSTRDDIELTFDRRTSIVTRGVSGRLLRALRVPEWPVVFDLDEHGTSRPAVELVVSGDLWTQVEHLHASRSYDHHYTAEAGEHGEIWLRVGDGRHGREIPMQESGRPAVELELRYRTGDPVTGNLGLGTATVIVPPATGTDEEVALAALGAVDVVNVVPGSGARPAHTSARIKEELPSSLRHGPLQRAVALDDYATAAMQVPGIGRATARSSGGLFNTVTVLVDPQGAGDLDEDLRRRVHDHLDHLRMAGREHVVLAAEYVPLEVELVLCACADVGASVVRSRVLAELEPGSVERPGWFHPDRLTFGSAVRLGDLLAFVQSIPGVRSVTASTFRPLGDVAGPRVRDLITLGRTRVARLDADPDLPEHGRLRVLMSGLDDDAPALAVDGAGAR